MDGRRKNVFIVRYTKIYVVHLSNDAKQITNLILELCVLAIEKKCDLLLDFMSLKFIEHLIMCLCIRLFLKRRTCYCSTTMVNLLLAIVILVIVSL